MTSRSVDKSKMDHAHHKKKPVGLHLIERTLAVNVV